MMSIDVSTKPEKAEIKALLKGTRFDSPYGKDHFKRDFYTMVSVFTTPDCFPNTASR